MKKYILFIVLIALFINTMGQSNFIEIGKSGWSPHCVWKIQVFDQYNNKPLNNAKVELFNDSYKLFSIRTNNEGIAIVIIYDITKIRNNMLLKVADSEYTYTQWEKEINQYDYYGGNNRKNMIVMSDLNDRVIDWSDGNNLPSSSKIASDISSNKNKIYESRNANYNYRGPGFFEFNVYLEYRHHPKNDIIITSINNNSIGNNLGRGVNGWTESTFDGEIQFVKNDKVLTLLTWGENYFVYRGDNSSNISLRLKEPIHENSLPFKEALRTAQEYMRRN